MYSYGPGPFEVLAIAERNGERLPADLVLMTDLGEKEVNEVWLALEENADDNAPRAVRSLRVLVVDDDHDTADSLCLLLAGWGHRPVVAYGGGGAWAAALAEKPDFVLLDLGLPGMDGWELARRLRNVPGLEGIILLAVTGYGQAIDREKSHAAGIDHHLVKPVEPQWLRRFLGAFCAEPGCGEAAGWATAQERRRG
jgi:CheY-like chemotaxis protein